MEDNIKFGKWLKGARESAGGCLRELSQKLQKDYESGKLSLRELGEVSQIDYTMLNKVERGSRFLSNAKIVHIARIFNIDPGELTSLQQSDRDKISAQKIAKGANIIPGFRPDVEVKVIKLLRIYREKKGGKKIQFPLDLKDFFKVVFGLETHHESFSAKGLWKKGQGRKLAALFVKERIISINSDAIDDRGNYPPEVNKRFSMAHEGSHFIRLTMKGGAPVQPIFFRSKDLQKYEKEESLVNYWAGALLMPKPELTDAIRKSKHEKIAKGVIIDLAQTAEDLCQKFGVSRQALEIRLKHIGITCKNSLYVNAEQRPKPF